MRPENFEYNSNIITNYLYIHWPFCPYKCHFCPFVALAAHDQYMQDYHNALCREIENCSIATNRKDRLESIFMGGGTPSTYPEDMLLDMFGKLNKSFIFDKQTEVTIEVNPGTVTYNKLLVWKQTGINRLSIGVQSLNTKVLHGLNRLQTNEDVFDLIDKASGLFNNISVDLIIGLPGVSEIEWKEFLAKVVTWPITHISIYFLTVHENTQLYFGVKKKKVVLPADEQVVDLYYWSVEFLSKNGFEQYEISNFAKKGFESRHNKAYWNRVPYKAFGLGACSFDGKMRFQNEKNLMTYINNLNNNKSVITFAEDLNSEQMV